MAEAQSHDLATEVVDRLVTVVIRELDATNGSGRP